MAYFAIDFDRTIASRQTHSLIAENIVSIGTDPEQQFKAIESVKPIVSAETQKTWRDAFEAILQDGHQVAIVSFSNFPVILRYLKECVGLPQEMLDQIKIVSWLPKNKKLGKNEHIKQALKESKYTGADDTVVLVDDDKNNIILAQKCGYQGILADETGSQIDEIIKLSKQLKLSTKATDDEPLLRRILTDFELGASVASQSGLYKKSSSLELTAASAAQETLRLAK